jgi:hypothetical protein
MNQPLAPHRWLPRPQFSLRLLLLAVTTFAIGFPIWYRWPIEEVTLEYPRISAKLGSRSVLLEGKTCPPILPQDWLPEPDRCAMIRRLRPATMRPVPQRGNLRKPRAQPWETESIVSRQPQRGEIDA